MLPLASSTLPEPILIASNFHHSQLPTQTPLPLKPTRVTFLISPVNRDLFCIEFWQVPIGLLLLFVVLFYFVEQLLRSTDEPDTQKLVLLPPCLTPLDHVKETSVPVWFHFALSLKEIHMGLMDWLFINSTCLEPQDQRPYQSFKVMELYGFN